MSDDRLRLIERRWRETGSPQDEAAHITERIRVGALLRSRVRAAAILGHPAALLVAGHPKRRKNSFIQALKVHGVGAQGWVRALVVIQRQICDDLRFSPRPALIIGALQLAWRWAYVPQSEMIPAEAWNLGNQCGLTAFDLTGRQDEVAFRWAALLAMFLRNPVNDFRRDLNDFVRTYGQRSRLPFLTFEGMQDFLQPVLGAWLLGYSDPLPRGSNPVYESDAS